MQKTPERSPRIPAFPISIAFTEEEGVVATLHADGTVTGDYKKLVAGLRTLERESNQTKALHLWAVAHALAQQQGKAPLDV
jgi:hypothetical protein